MTEVPLQSSWGAGVSEDDQGGDHDQGAEEASQPFRGHIWISKIHFQTLSLIDGGGVWALGLDVFKASDMGLKEKWILAICFSSSSPSRHIHLVFVHVGCCSIVFCFVFPPTPQ